MPNPSEELYKTWLQRYGSIAKEAAKPQEKAQKEAEKQAEAARLYDAGERLTKAGDHQGALEAFQQAQELIPHPQTEKQIIALSGGSPTMVIPGTDPTQTISPVTVYGQPPATTPGQRLEKGDVAGFAQGMAKNWARGGRMTGEQAGQSLKTVAGPGTEVIGKGLGQAAGDASKLDPTKKDKTGYELLKEKEPLELAKRAPRLIPKVGQMTGQAAGQLESAVGGINQGQQAVDWAKANEVEIKKAIRTVAEHFHKAGMSEENAIQQATVLVKHHVGH